MRLVALQIDAATEKSKDRLSRDFYGCSIFNFCNTICHKQTSRDEIDYPGRASMLGCHSGLYGPDQVFRRTSNVLT